MSVQTAVYRTTDAMKYLNVGRTFFYKLIRTGFLPKPHKHGGQFTFWTKDELDKCIEKMKGES